MHFFIGDYFAGFIPVDCKRKVSECAAQMLHVTEQMLVAVLPDVFSYFLRFIFPALSMHRS